MASEWIIGFKFFDYLDTDVIIPGVMQCSLVWIASGYEDKNQNQSQG